MLQSLITKLLHCSIGLIFGATGLKIPSLSPHLLPFAKRANAYIALESAREENDFLTDGAEMATGGIISTDAIQKGVEAKGECVMEAKSRRILYASHADLRLPMASTTKILTAATVLDEEKTLSREISIPPQAAGVEGSSVYLKSGDIYTVQDLLYGLMLRSGNDCATALALHISGSLADFSAKMNLTAQKSGAFDSRFENPHGLPQKNHYTTAKDLSYITCYAMENPTFREIVSTEYYSPRAWKNKNKMLRLCEGGIGVKTGYTKEAGRCLVSAAERGNMTLICTVLNCPTTYERSIELLDDAFEAYENVLLVGEKEQFTLGEGKNAVVATTGEAFYYPLLKEEKDLISVQTKRYTSYKKKEKSGDVVGEIQIYLAKHLLFSRKLYKL